jgi:signal transduction histidine kinase
MTELGQQGEAEVDLATRAVDRGFGLDSIRRRARLLGGTATIKSSPGNGTCVSVRLPLRDGG